MAFSRPSTLTLLLLAGSFVASSFAADPYTLCYAGGFCAGNVEFVGDQPSVNDCYQECLDKGAAEGVTYSYCT